MDAQMFCLYILLDEVPAIASGILEKIQKHFDFFKPKFSPGYSGVLWKNVSPFGSAVFPTIADIQINIYIYIYERRCIYNLH